MWGGITRGDRMARRIRPRPQRSVFSVNAASGTASSTAMTVDAPAEKAVLEKGRPHLAALKGPGEALQPVKRPSVRNERWASLSKG